MLKKKILLFSFLFFVFLMFSSAQTQFKLYVPSYEVAQGQAKIDIMVENAPQIGALQFDLFYDPKVMEIVNVSAGKLASKAMIVDNVDNRNGTATIGIVSLSGFSGKGSIITLYANIHGSKGDSSELKLSMEKRSIITDTKNKELNLPVLESGMIRVSEDMRWVIIAVILIIITILVVVWLWKKRIS